MQGTRYRALVKRNVGDNNENHHTSDNSTVCDNSLGCRTSPQAGTYLGTPGAFGPTTLIVRSDGTISDIDGPLRREGTWVAVTNMIIRAEIQGLEKHASTSFYALEKESCSFRWTYNLQELTNDGKPNQTLRGTVSGRTDRIRIHDERTAANLREMIVPGIALPCSTPLPDVVAFLQSALDANSEEFGVITIVMNDFARSSTITNDWPVVSGPRRRAQEYLDMISCSADVWIDINLKEVQIFSTINQ